MENPFEGRRNRTLVGGDTNELYGLPSTVYKTSDSEYSDTEGHTTKMKLSASQRRVRQVALSLFLLVIKVRLELYPLNIIICYVLIIGRCVYELSLLVIIALDRS